MSQVASVFLAAWKHSYTFLNLLDHLLMTTPTNGPTSTGVLVGSNWTERGLHRTWLWLKCTPWLSISSQLINKQSLFFSDRMEAGLRALSERAIIVAYGWTGST
jgi:hypothetical protein